MLLSHVELSRRSARAYFSFEHSQGCLVRALKFHAEVRRLRHAYRFIGKIQCEMVTCLFAGIIIPFRRMRIRRV